MSVERSIVKYLSAQVSEFSGRVYVGNNPDLDLENISVPFCVVSRIGGYTEKVVYIGDQSRQVDGDYQIDIYTTNYEDMVNLDIKVRKLLRNATGQEDYSDILSTNRGIDLYGVEQVLTTTNQLTYKSGQSGWFSNPTPVIYKNNTLITTGFTIDYVNGEVVFNTANAPSDIIRATYKCGLIDIEEAGVVYETPPNAEHRPLFSAFITIRPFIYFKGITQTLI